MKMLLTGMVAALALAAVPVSAYAGHRDCDDRYGVTLRFDTGRYYGRYDNCDRYSYSGGYYGRYDYGDRYHYTRHHYPRYDYGRHYYRGHYDRGYCR